MATGGYSEVIIREEFEGIVGTLNTVDVKDFLLDERLPTSHCKETDLNILESLIDAHGKNPDDLIEAITQTNAVFLHCLTNKMLPSAEIVAVLKILSIVCESNRVQLLKLIFSKVETSFIDTLDNFLNMVSMRMQSHVYFWKHSDNLLRCCLLSLDVITYILNLGSEAFEKYKRLIDSLKSIQNEFRINSEFSGRVKEIDVEFQERLTKYQKLIRKKDLPPNNFRTLDIVPSVDELHGKQKPFLRKNITNGSYGDLETYLDIHYRLLREDFVRQMKIGIMEYRKHVRTQTKGKIREIHLFRHVKIDTMEFSSSGVTYFLKFQKKAGQKTKSSKRLLTGNLVCITPDQFDSMIFGTITNSEKIENGIVGVQIQESQTSRIEKRQTYIMAEAAALFLPYKCALTCLKTITDCVPLQQYIVHASTDVRPPAYLLTDENISYNFSSLFSRPPQERAVYRRYAFSAPEIDQRYIFPVLDTDNWPVRRETCLDEAQYEAMKTALTQELTIIQGPPGTGKTFIGLKIAKLLSENACKIEDPRPILVVCYTNHALDQFLEGIESFCSDQIVRVGGRTKSLVLEKYEYRRLKKRERLSANVRYHKLHFNMKVDHCSSLLHKCRQTLRTTELPENVLTFDDLSVILTREELDYIEQFKKEEQNNPILTWLGLDLPPVSPGNFPTPKDKAYAYVFFTWCQFIVEWQVSQRTLDTNTTNMWSMMTRKRVELYKYWIHEVSSEIENHIKVLLMDNTRNAFEQVYNLEVILIELNTKIVPATRILSFVTNIKTWNEIFCLRCDGLSIDEALQKWLYVDCTPDSIRYTATELNNIGHLNGFDLDRYLHGDSFPTKVDVGLYQWCNEIHKRRNRTSGRYIHELYRRQVQRNCNIAMTQTMTHLGRFELYLKWVDRLRNHLLEKIKSIEAEFHTFTNQCEQVETEVMADILQRAKFIGMTTTKAAMHRDALAIVAPKIVLIEEAAEVLEAHVIASLSTKCQHLILIGDHKQLRPPTTIYELSKKYKLDISLFERLVNNNIPCVTLSEQHRMRPEISKFMRHPDLYPNLKDHVHVTRYKDVLGLVKNVVFLNHDQEEDMNDDILSYSNEHEVGFIQPFVTYLLQQGYSEENITIITPYVGQVLKLQSCFPRSESQLKITTIDNYQGEENEIVILSLVRSKKESSKSSIGFVGIENRICVSLSRAREGLFVIGNFDHLRRHSTMWEYMVHQIERNGGLLCALPLKCQNHPETITNVKHPKDFELVPNGGCNVACGKKLNCNHICSMKCHILDSKHVKYTCTVQVEKTFSVCGHTTSVPCHKTEDATCERICNNLLGCGHNCPENCKSCNMTCSAKNCNKRVRKLLACGHYVQIECSRDPITITCSTKIIKTLPCGHQLQLKCHVDVHNVKCNELVTKDMPCGHLVKAKCSTACCEIKCRQNVTKHLPCEHDLLLPCSSDVLEVICPTLVTKILPCGHALNMACGLKVTSLKCNELVKKTLSCSHDIQVKCSENGVIECKRQCTKTLMCGHKCTGTCKTCFQGRVHRGCNGPCVKKLDCGHICEKPCHIICPPCSKKCSKRCSHSSCELLCLQPCNECNKLCRNGCKHKKCKALCQELCTVSYCNKRCNKLLKCNHHCASVCGETCVCLQCSDFQEKGKVDHNSTKLYLQLPDCKCIIDLQIMDKHMTQGNNVNAFYLTCPNIDCGKVMHTDIKRYSNILKSCKQRLDEKHKQDLCGKLDQTTRKLVTDLKQKISKSASDRLLRECSNIKSQVDVKEFKLKVELLSKIFPNGKMFHFRENIPHMILSFQQLEEFVLEKGRKLTNQFLLDFETEVFRSNSFIQLSGFQNRVYVPKEVSDNILLAEYALSHTLHLTRGDKKTIKRMLLDIKRRIDMAVKSPTCDICEMLEESVSCRLQNETIDTDTELCDNNLPNIDIGTSRTLSGDIVENTVIQTKFNFEIMFQDLEPLSSKTTPVNVTSQTSSAGPLSTVVSFLGPSEVFSLHQVTKGKDVESLDRKEFISQITSVEKCTGQRMIEIYKIKKENGRPYLKPRPVRNRRPYKRR